MDYLIESGREWRSPLDEVEPVVTTDDTFS